MKTASIKQSLLSTINGIDDRDTGLLEKLIVAVKSILRQNNPTMAEKDEITPYVNSMKTGVKLPSDLDIKVLREEHINEKYS